MLANDDLARTDIASPEPRTSAPRSFLADVVIDFGPRDVLARLFLKADTELRRLGVTLSIAGLDELVAVNRQHGDSWRPILPLFDPAFGGIDERNAFAVLGRNAAGEVVTAQACRLYDLTAHSLKEEIESLRVFYANPARSKLPGEAMLVTAPSAATTYGRCVFSGGAWYRPDYRRKGVIHAVAPAIRALAYTRWQSDFVFSFMVEELVAAGTAARARFPHVERHVIMIDTPVYRGQSLPVTLVWTNAEEQLAHFREYTYPGA